MYKLASLALTTWVNTQRLTFYHNIKEIMGC